MFSKLLIANRGEIACRIARSARRLRIATVAVYSDADAGALHVAEADEAWRIGPAPAGESYLRVDRLIEVAKAAGAEAVHPGYGFLSENAGFAEACAAAGLVFVGPPADAIRAMGSKSEAKMIMERAGVPLVPGYHGQEQDGTLLAEEAARIGFPVLIKASAGGGGKGMRVVSQAGDFTTALEGAKREAAAAFGDEQVLIEKYLTRPRHVEVQVFADSHGNVVHLFERDCSLQRRHQKVVEEAPAPNLDPALRTAMGQAAIAAAQAIGYRGAGTVEFIFEEDAFYFMEMNTRLQVEHPVTEMITGFDLVEWQLRVAAGEELPAGQEEIEARGHAMEVRLYAEDPQRDFLPASGRLDHLRFPEEEEHLRIDSGVRSGDEISPYYDPMIAKLIVWGEDRGAALRHLQRALRRTEIAGPATNLPLLQAIAEHPAFRRAEIDTGFIPRHAEELLTPSSVPHRDLLALACLAEVERRCEETAASAAASPDRWSPWWRSDGWRLNVQTRRSLTFELGEERHEVAVEYPGHGLEVVVEGERLPARAEQLQNGDLLVDLGDRRLRMRPVWRGDDLTLLWGGMTQRLRLLDPQIEAVASETAASKVVAPMPGRLVQLQVAPGEVVTRGQPLLLLEAMKMEHTLLAPRDGRISTVHFSEGEQVEEGAELVSFASEEDEEGAEKRSEW
ncbi:MAG TPA: acetyl/propionyl/methylcrotonyl-CoA carboxylase subunit alpha [Kiloniellales bacterium]|nr:acetyl/propionyl/methylcrotonyl-CoA carboxylase subunit alpha [Kiloniellales bacterium]